MLHYLLRLSKSSVLDDDCCGCLSGVCNFFSGGWVFGALDLGAFKIQNPFDTYIYLYN